MYLHIFAYILFEVGTLKQVFKMITNKPSAVGLLPNVFISISILEDSDKADTHFLHELDFALKIKNKVPTVLSLPNL